MNCEHRFTPFPGSRSKLYCEFCGVGRDAFAEARPSPRRPAGRRATSSGRAQTETPQTSLDLRPPEIDDAQDILAIKRLESAVRSIVAGQDLDGTEAEEIIKEALDYGPELDLDHFAKTVARMGSGGGQQQFEDE